MGNHLSFSWDVLYPRRSNSFLILTKPQPAIYIEDQSDCPCLLTRSRTWIHLYYNCILSWMVCLVMHCQLFAFHRTTLVLIYIAFPLVGLIACAVCKMDDMRKQRTFGSMGTNRFRIDIKPATGFHFCDSTFRLPPAMALVTPMPNILNNIESPFL